MSESPLSFTGRAEIFRLIYGPAHATLEEVILHDPPSVRQAAWSKVPNWNRGQSSYTYSQQTSGGGVFQGAENHDKTKEKEDNRWPRLPIFLQSDSGLLCHQVIQENNNNKKTQNTKWKRQWGNQTDISSCWLSRSPSTVICQTRSLRG